MGQEPSNDQVTRLLEALSKDCKDLGCVVAVLWTWLEANLQALGGLQAKSIAIRALAETAGPFSGQIENSDLGQILDAPLLNAAVLLARIDLHVDENEIVLAEGAYGWDGTPVIVATRQPSLALAYKSADWPPAADEYPSLPALAPNLNVCPVESQHGIKLGIVDPGIQNPEVTEIWAHVKVRLFRSMQAPSSLKVHLDTLGDVGLSGWTPDSKENKAGHFDSEKMAEEDRANCLAAACAAVGEAAGEPSILVLPELALTPECLDAVVSELKDQDQAPLLTVAGLKHVKCENDELSHDALVGDAAVAEYVNEAVVLGPDGKELWRHRKLTSASADLGAGPVTENVRPGEYMDAVPSPIGMISVVICLDVFREHIRDRIARSPAEVLLVPSLSQTSFRHRVSLHQTVQNLWGIAFVCNRAMLATDDAPSIWNSERNRSFCVAQRSREVDVPEPVKDGLHPSFIFDLKDRYDQASKS